MFKDYDLVIAKNKLSDNVLSGCEGTILMTFTNKSNQNYYEVEFFDDEGNSLDVLTVSESDLLLKK